jgi:hypothetical protein
LLLGEEGALELLGLHDGINESDSVGDSFGLRLGDVEGALLCLLLGEMLGAALSDPEVGGGGIIGNKRLGTGIGCSLQLSLGEDAEGVPKGRLLGLEEGTPDGRLLGFNEGKPVGDSDSGSKGDWLGLALGASEGDSWT